MEPLSQRYQEVLEVLVADYIASAQPVGSRTISKHLTQRLSPATVRNIMADLTDMGLLTQPHTSAGRIPTSDGLQYYADTMLQVHALTEQEQSMIRDRCGGESGVHQFLHKASSVMSAISRHVGLVVTPGFEEIIFKQLQFLRLSQRRLLGIFVAQNGMVQNRIIEVDHDFTFSELEKVNNFCNQALTGLNLAEARAKIRKELEQLQSDYDTLLRQSLLFSEHLLGSVPDRDLVVEGESTFVEYKEFEQFQELLKTLEEKQQLLKLFDRTREAEGVKIFVGTDQMPGSLVSAPYCKEGQVVGVLGVIGPQRMNYSHVVPIVDFTAKLVSDFLEQR